MLMLADTAGRHVGVSVSALGRAALPVLALVMMGVGQMGLNMLFIAMRAYCSDHMWCMSEGGREILVLILPLMPVAPNKRHFILIASKWLCADALDGCMFPCLMSKAGHDQAWPVSTSARLCNWACTYMKSILVMVQVIHGTQPIVDAHRSSGYMPFSLLLTFFSVTPTASCA